MVQLSPLGHQIHAEEIAVLQDDAAITIEIVGRLGFVQIAFKELRMVGYKVLVEYLVHFVLVAVVRSSLATVFTTLLHL